MEPAPLAAGEACQQARPGEHVIGWRLDPADRRELLARFPPAYAQAVADHVTLKSRVSADSALPREHAGEIVGRSDDGRGVEAMVIRIGRTTARPGGGTYHVTWSIAAGREAHESNEVIAARGWQAVDPPIAVRLEPARYP